MKKKDFRLGQDARDSIITVATHFGDILGATLGPAGRNYMLPTGITNDGKTIAKNLRYEKEYEDDIALSFFEVLERTDTEAGDGTTTSGVTVCELAKTAIAKVAPIDAPTSKANVMALARQLESEKDQAITLLREKAHPVTTVEELVNVAQTAMEDDGIAKLVAETVFEAGKDSYTALEDGYTGTVERTVFRGMRVPARTAAPYMHTNDKKEAVYVNTHVLVADHVFEDYSELRPLMLSLQQANDAKTFNAKALIIVARHFSIPFIGQVANTARAAGFPMVLLQLDAPTEVFEDVAAMLDAQLIDTNPRTGRRISEASFKHCGLVGKMVASSHETVFINGRGLETMATSAARIKDGGEPTTVVQARVLALEEQLKEEKAPAKRKELKKRISSLSGGIATIFVDAQTAQERHYLKLKVEDTINACKSALHHGVVPGGGQTMRDIAEEMGADTLLYTALRAPYERIQQNAGGSLNIPATVLDSVHSIETGLRNAVSVVKVLLTVEGVISDHVRDFAQELGEALFKDPQ